MLVEPHPARQRLLRRGVLEVLDQPRAVGEVHLLAGHHRLVAYGYRQVGLADARAADEHDVVAAVDELERGKLLDQPARHARLEAPVEVGQRLYVGADCDILIVDECSTVCNSDMKFILDSNRFKLLLLVGDVRQIESIKFGNWFSLARDFLPDKCIHEFDKPWRTKNDDLLKLWHAVRNVSPDIAEILISCDFTSNLDDSVISRMNDDEIVLCLNYDGLYGINNMNKILQSGNKNEAVVWNYHTYKVGDPILFNESERFYPLLYNNLKGRLVGIETISKDEMQFTVAVPIITSELSVLHYDGLEYLDFRDGETYLRFSVKKAKDRDGEDVGEDCIVPFQVAYAVSVHKAQGLEYSSVKLIITKDVEERITHSVFYTAITRARERLHIYWSPESQNKILSSFEISKEHKDAYLLSNRKGLKIQRK